MVVIYSLSIYSKNGALDLDIKLNGIDETDLHQLKNNVLKEYDGSEFTKDFIEANTLYFINTKVKE